MSVSRCDTLSDLGWVHCGCFIGGRLNAFGVTTQGRHGELLFASNYFYFLLFFDGSTHQHWLSGRASFWIPKLHHLCHRQAASNIASVDLLAPPVMLEEGLFILSFAVPHYLRDCTPFEINLSMLFNLPVYLSFQVRFTITIDVLSSILGIAGQRWVGRLCINLVLNWLNLYKEISWLVCLTDWVNNMLTHEVVIYSLLTPVARIIFALYDFAMPFRGRLRRVLRVFDHLEAVTHWWLVVRFLLLLLRSFNSFGLAAEGAFAFFHRHALRVAFTCGWVVVNKNETNAVCQGIGEDCVEFADVNVDALIGLEVVEFEPIFLVIYWISIGPLILLVSPWTQRHMVIPGKGPEV